MITSIRTERLTLDPVTLDDVPALFEVAREKDSIEDFQYVATTAEDVRKWLEPSYRDPEVFCWVMRKDGRVIGLMEVMPGPEYSEVKEGVCNIGYFLDWREQRQGLTTEAMRGVVNWLFSETDIERIEAGVTLNNPASYRVLEKVGFVREKLVEKNWEWYGELYDSVYYCLVRPSDRSADK